MAARLFLLLASLFLLVTSREPPWADAHVVYDTTESFVEHHDFAVRMEGGPPWFYAHPKGPTGPKYGVFPLGNVLAMVPSYLAYKALRNLPGVPDRPLGAMICHLSPALLMAGACVFFFFLLARRRLPPGEDGDRWAAGMTLVLATSTIVFIYARSPYAEALQTFALTMLVERTVNGARTPTVTALGWVGVAAGLLINAKLVFVLVLPLVALYLVWARSKENDVRRLLISSWLALVEFFAFVALALWHNHMKTGSLFDSGYTMRGGLFSGDLLPALHGFLLSSGKGVFWYSPPLILGIFGLRESLRRFRGETMLMVGIALVTLLVNAKFRIWHADYCWGPRHLAPVAPLMLLWALPWLPEALARGRVRLRWLALRALVALGISVQLLGASLYWDHYIRALIEVKDQTGAPGWFRESLSHGHYIPAFSPLVGQWWLLSHMIRRDPDLDHDAPWKSIIPSVTHLEDVWGRVRIDWWPLEWLTNHDPFRPGMRPKNLRGDPPTPFAATAIAFFVLSAGVWIGARGLRRQR